MGYSPPQKKNPEPGNIPELRTCFFNFLLFVFNASSLQYPASSIQYPASYLKNNISLYFGKYHSLSSTSSSSLSTW